MTIGRFFVLFPPVCPAFAGPSGMNVVVFPASYGQDCKTGASIVLLSCAGSILSVPVLYAIVQVLFG